MLGIPIVLSVAAIVIGLWIAQKKTKTGTAPHVIDFIPWVYRFGGAVVAVGVWFVYIIATQ